MPAIAQIRPLTTIDQCREVAALEREIWGFTDSEDIVPPAVLIVSIKRGGILLGAFDGAGTMCGFVYSVPGVKNRVVTHWSHMLGVVAAARHTGLGGRLKLAQREAALEMGVELVEWTYDPLQALNAHLNFAKLGVVATEYAENIYGSSSSPLHHGTPTDRFVVEWHLTRPHAERRIAAWGKPVVRDQSVAGSVLLNPSVARGRHLSPGGADLEVDARRLLVEIPGSFSEIQASDPDLALAWRLHTREIFQTCFGRGYRAVDFFLSREAGRGHYLLVREGE
jgi:predicted GNAT superfamily acetyltransferase